MNDLIDLFKKLCPPFSCNNETRRLTTSKWKDPHRDRAAAWETRRKMCSPFFIGGSGEKSHWINSLHSTLLDPTRVDSILQDVRAWSEKNVPRKWNRRAKCFPSRVINFFLFFFFFLYLRPYLDRVKSLPFPASWKLAPWENGILTRDIDIISSVLARICIVKTRIHPRIYI